MPSFLSPGVYVQEVPSGGRSIEAASTSTPIFVGETERGPLGATRITSRTDFERKYGGYHRLTGTALSTGTPTLAYAMDAFFQNGGQSCYVLRVFGTTNRADAKKDSTAPGLGGSATRTSTSKKVQLVATSQGKWAEAAAGIGLHALILPPSDGSSGRFRIVVGYTPTHAGAKQGIMEDFDRLSTDPNDENYVLDTLARSVFIRWDPATAVAAPDPAQDYDKTSGKNTAIKAGINPTTEAELLDSFDHTKNGFSGAVGGDADVGEGDYPAELSLLDDIRDASLLVIPQVNDDTNVYKFYEHGRAYAERRPLRDLFVIGAMKRYKNEVVATDAAVGMASDFDKTPLNTSSFSSLYAPWLIVTDPAGQGKNPTVAVDPSAAVAGLYGRTDSTRGVWKAPAGTEATVAGIQRLEHAFGDKQQDLLNVRGINAIRPIAGAGNVVWGSRTTQVNSEWRYVPVRRMAIFLRMSLYNGMQFAVFEPNDFPLWATLRLTASGFMDRLFRQGAFQGATPKEAYFVKCDSETTTASDQLAGFVNLLVGFSPLKPAEFVIIRLSQMAAKA